MAPRLSKLLFQTKKKRRKVKENRAGVDLHRLVLLNTVLRTIRVLKAESMSQDTAVQGLEANNVNPERNAG
ncbi:hypothetical protein V5799_023121 [Amblyomma americanum]|uniref:Uncharacterized protein n=1 Tax=Amblyomma americanum TaxID=6943 RepID=A0AAQ4FJ74_AMBAM